MENRVYYFFKVYLKQNFLLFVFYPILMPFFVSYSLLKSGKNVFPLLFNAKRAYYTGNTFHTALNNYFYTIQYLNIKKFGRFGKSAFIGGGDYPLSNLIHLSPLGLKTMVGLGAPLFSFLSMIFWLAVVFCSADSWSLHHLVIVFTIATSALFYVNAFGLQNYNIGGWALFPFALYGLVNHNVMIFLISTMLMPILSFTSVFIVFWFTLFAAIYYKSLFFLLLLLPSLFISVFPVFIAFLKNKKSVYKTGLSIGFFKNAKYKREDTGIYKLLFSVFFLLFPIVYFKLYGLDLYFIFLILPFLLYISNILVARFADVQTFFITYLTSASFVILRLEFQPLIFLAYFLSINPPYGFIGLEPLGKLFFNPPSRNPINTHDIIEKLEYFIKKVPEGARIFISFKDPQNKYNKIFDRHFIFMQPFQSVAFSKKICIFPDWYFIFDNNSMESSYDFWTRHPQEAIIIMKKYNLDYALIYQEKNETTLQDWLNLGFEIVSCFDWAQVIKSLKLNYEGKKPKWWILKYEK